MQQFFVVEVVPLHLERGLSSNDVQFHVRRSTVAEQRVVGHGQFELVVRHLKQPLQVQFSLTSVFQVHFHQGRIQRPISHALPIAKVHSIDGPVVRHWRIGISRVLNEIDADFRSLIARNRHHIWHRRLKRGCVVDDDGDFTFNGATHHLQIQGFCPLINVVLRHFERQ